MAAVITRRSRYVVDVDWESPPLVCFLGGMKKIWSKSTSAWKTAHLYWLGIGQKRNRMCTKNSALIYAESRRKDGWLKMWCRVRLIVGRGGTCGTHTRPHLALNLFVRELSKRHDSCECTISSLLERAPPCHVQWAGWSAILFLFWFYLLSFLFLQYSGCFWETDRQDGYHFVLYFLLLFDYGSSWP